MTNNIVESKQLMEALKEPFDLKEIEWRVQTATKSQNGYRVLVLPYITVRSTTKRLDEICGGFWQSHFDKITVGGIEAFQCRLSLKIGDEWIIRTDAAEVSDFNAVKGGHSNALKRAGVQWGIGRYLYDIQPFWVELKKRGEHNVYGNFKINKVDTFLEGYFDTPKLPQWALPSGQAPAPQQPMATPTEQPSQQQQNKIEIKKELTAEEKQSKALFLVNQLLESLQMPYEYIAPLLQEINGVTVPYTEASADDLGGLYHVLFPVYQYVKACRVIGLDEERMLFYAQIVLKEGFENVYSLLMKMTKEDCTKILELIKEDLNLDEKVG
ncbi:Rad52/Rad22 family DNA repair protein [Sporosarcina sp. FSL K6-1508]|uniref:Rad52/Rad22 family DNA repair protein n=1 Tax=Sporosarcina sp. FSL K6-1508 TaxID=2921553 RepID=UPI0030FB8551